MNGGFIINNRTTENGGGVYVDGGGTFYMAGGTIEENTAGIVGGGVFIFGESDFSKIGGSSIDGTANISGAAVPNPGHAVYWQSTPALYSYRDTALGAGDDLSTDPAGPGWSNWNQ
jgi:hypothetical protein